MILMKSEVKIKSRSGKQIELLLVESTTIPLLTIIDSPGGFIESKEKAVQGNSTLIEFCQKNQINYVSIDFSNNGKYKDQPVNELRFSHRIKDLETAIDYVSTNHKAPVVLLGSSLGGFITLNAANFSSEIRGVILNCAAVKANICIEMGMPPEEFKNWKQKGIAIVWGVPFTYDFYEDLVNLNAMKVIPTIDKPILWFHGTDDMTVPITQAHEAKYHNHNIELVEVQGGGHRFGDKMRPGEWENKVEEFILRLLRKSNTDERDL